MPLYANIGKFVSLDLSACTKSGESAGGGLRSSGDFDPISGTTTGKAKIVNLTLPTLATGIVAGTYSAPTFNNFTVLKTVSGAGVTTIGNIAFYSTAGQSALTSASFPLAAAIGEFAFSNCKKLTSVSIPKAAAIGIYAFAYCKKLTSVNIPKVTTIGRAAFNYCRALTNVTLGATPPMLGTSIFWEITTAQTVTVKIPASAKSAYGVPNLPGTNFDNTNTTADNWGNALRGKGWNGTTYGNGVSSSVNSASTDVNNNITLVFETY
jgi:hypothetical protein